MTRIWKGSQSLYWLLPIIYGSAATIALSAVFFKPGIVSNRFLFHFVTPYCIVQPIGGWWVIYQCVRYERRPWRYVAIVLVPAGFFWYFFERYSIRERRLWLAQERRERSENS